jgi:hypothetical protein
MDKIQKQDSLKYITPSSKPFSIDVCNVCKKNVRVCLKVQEVKTEIHIKSRLEILKKLDVLGDRA